MMKNNEFRKIYESYKLLIEQRLDMCLSGERLPQETLREAMRYSLLAGGRG